MPNKRLAHCCWAATLLALPALMSAQGISGAASGMLSERANYLAFFPARDTSPDVLLILRGQPNWATGPAAQRGYAMARSSIGPVSANQTAFIDYGITVSGGELEVSYRLAGRVLRFGGEEYPLDADNVIVIDHVDGVGGAPRIVHGLRLQLPARSGEAFPAAHGTPNDNCPILLGAL